MARELTVKVYQYGDYVGEARLSVLAKDRYHTKQAKNGSIRLVAVRSTK